MSERWDAIVIGGGHNGLTAAILLARAGRRTLVVERRERVGGLAAGEEFHPRYRAPGVLHDTSAVRPWVVERLRLAEHGLELESEEWPVLAPRAAGGGDGLLLWREPERAAEELGRTGDGADAEAYRRYRAFVDRVTPLIRRAVDRPPTDLAEPGARDLWDLGRLGLSLRLLGKRDMTELLRVGPMCVADWLREHFASDLLAAALAAPAVYGTWCGPWSPGTCTNLLLAEAFRTPGVRGGAPALVASLERAAWAAGIEIRTGVEARRLEVEDGRVRGVTVAPTGDGRAEERAAGARAFGGGAGSSGETGAGDPAPDGAGRQSDDVAGSEETLTADLVAASCDPRHLLLDLLPSHHLTLELEHGITHFRARGTTAKVHLALSGYPSFACRPGLEAEWIRIADGIDDLERAFDPVKYRRLGDRPALDIHVPTLRTPEMAPAGHHVLSVGVHFVPWKLDGGWTDARRAQLGEIVLARLERYAPGVRDLLVASQVLTPADLADRYRLPEGHLHHGEHALDQILVRPVPECARHATPFRGLYLCGSGSYPGGGLTCVPGALGAERLLADR